MMHRSTIVLSLVAFAAGCSDPASTPADDGGSSSGAASSSSGDGGSSSAATTAVDSSGGTSTGTDDGGSSSTTGEPPAPWVWDLPPGFPEPYVPAQNPMSAEKVELGRHLFYDLRLSGNGTQSCASCHDQARGFADGLPTPQGSTGSVLARNSMGLTNSVYSYPLTWANPNLVDLEHQILVPLFGEFPIELGAVGHEDEILQRLRDEPVYGPLFEAAFPERDDPFSFDAVRDALACFTRTLISGDSPYDRFVYGDGELSESALRGMNLFFSEAVECHHCHGSFNFSMSVKHANTVFDPQAFHNTGLYNVGGTGAYPLGNEGLYESTALDTDRGRFRAPTLRNVAVSGPYMHDGSIATLEEVLDTYAAGGRNVTEGPFAGDGRANPYKSGFVGGFEMSPQDRDDLLAFLHSLTDETFLGDPRFANPWP
ncbi:MAG: di-heme enzyme [Nannocystaceae bacterium]|nr:di-heme enzyme [Nannocystaceae bacterium]